MAIVKAVKEFKPIPRSKELGIQVRLPRNGAKGYIINFYKGSKHIAWHHVATGNIVDLGKVIYRFLREESLPIDRVIDLRKEKT